MWCPDEFVTLSSIIYRGIYVGQRYANTIFPLVEVDHNSLAKAFGECMRDQAGKPQPWFGDGLERELALAASELFAAWVTDSCIYCFDPYLCSPTGGLVKVEPRVICHELDLGMSEWTSMGVPPELVDVCRYNASTSDSIWEGFRMFLHPGGILQEMQWANGGGDLLELRKMISKKFCGWAVCFRERDIPQDDDKLLTELGFDNSLLWVEEDESEEQSTGRLAFTFKCLIQAYPDGRRDSWPETERRTGFSRRTIMRALSAHNAGWWAKGAGK